MLSSCVSTILLKYCAFGMFGNDPPQNLCYAKRSAPNQLLKLQCQERVSTLVIHGLWTHQRGAVILYISLPLCHCAAVSPLLLAPSVPHVRSRSFVRGHPLLPRSSQQHPVRPDVNAFLLPFRKGGRTQPCRQCRGRIVGG